MKVFSRTLIVFNAALTWAPLPDSRASSPLPWTLPSGNGSALGCASSGPSSSFHSRKASSSPLAVPSYHRPSLQRLVSRWARSRSSAVRSWDLTSRHHGRSDPPQGRWDLHTDQSCYERTCHTAARPSPPGPTNGAYCIANLADGTCLGPAHGFL